MKGLLQSKKFRENLYKWLFMYVGVLVILTSVITYSKYISRFLGSGDNARVAKFNVEIKPLECKDKKTEKTCNQTSSWSTFPIEYYFYVDTKELEITADLKITIDVNENFKVLHLEEITNLEEILEEEKIVDFENMSTKELSYTNTQNGAILLPGYSRVLAGSGTKKGYRITVQYQGTDTINQNYNILKMNYAAEQKS